MRPGAPQDVTESASSLLAVRSSVSAGTENMRILCTEFLRICNFARRTCDFLRICEFLYGEHANFCAECDRARHRTSRRARQRLQLLLEFAGTVTVDYSYSNSSCRQFLRLFGWGSSAVPVYVYKRVVGTF